MYNNSAQYPGQSYQTAYPQYQANYNSNYGAYQGYETAQQYVNPAATGAATVGGGAGDNYPQNSWSTVGAYGNQQAITQPTDVRKEAVAQEMKQQKEQLVKQREDYVKKSAVLRRELDQLRNQKQDLLSDGSKDRDIEMILKENDKLQEEIQGKLKAINNVIEMLSSIIKDGRNVSELEASFADDFGKKVGRKEALGGASAVELDDGSKYCYIHYDTGMHWCRICDAFPETAKEFLFHLQSKRHLEKVKENDLGDNSPWHKLPPEPLLPSYENAPKKRIPIKGLQFFISAPSWYCKLCDIWIGDLHCASHHLKSQTHSQNYDIFIQQNPQWEVDWYKDREKAMSRSTKRDSSDSDDSDKKRKKRKDKDKRHSESSSRDKKKRKKSKKRKKHSSDSSSSSSSSDSSSDDDINDKTKSIRVAMRNIKAQNLVGDDLQDKWQVLERLVEEHKEKEKVKEKERYLPKPEDALINQWMTVSEPQDDDKLMLDNLRSRMKQKQKLEDAKAAEMERKRLEKERQEREMFERKQREAKEAAEAAEREKKRREQEELDRIRDKERNQVKFKPNRDGYRQRRSSKSDDEDDRPNNRYNHRERTRSRSRSSERRNSDKRKHSSSSSSSNKKLPFIGRMPLFKNKKVEEKDKDHKEIKKEEYEPQRKTRFQPGNLARAFIPQPDVVCFPKLSSYPPLSAPPPPPMTEKPLKAPAPPKIKEKEKEPEVPPAPFIGHDEAAVNNSVEIAAAASHEQTTAVDPNALYQMNQYYTDYSMYNYSMYGDYQQQVQETAVQQSEEAMVAPPPPDMSHTMPLQPPPLPPSEPEDDLALLGICADDMAAQTF